MTTDVPPELSRPVPIDRISSSGLTLNIEADTQECAAIARRLMIPGVASVRCAWRLRPSQGGRLEAEGSLRARTRQVCVVTLDEFESELVEEFSILFVPSGTEQDTSDDPDEPDQLPFTAGVLDVGEATVEQLALALEPYPRKPGAELPETDYGQPEGPWVALTKWRASD